VTSTVSCFHMKAFLHHAVCCHLTLDGACFNQPSNQLFFDYCLLVIKFGIGFFNCLYMTLPSKPTTLHSLS